MPVPIQVDGTHVDLSGRLFHSTTVAASPSAATETTICTVTCPGDIAITKAIYLLAFFAFTVGTSGVSARARLRQTSTAGAVVGDTGLVTVVAASLFEQALVGVDTAPVMPGQVYVLTLTVGSGAAVSTVSNAAIVALAA